MRNLKKFLTLALAVVMVVSVFAFSASAAQFTDVDENNEYLAKAVNLLSNVGITKGTSETTYGTEELVTREQMAAFIYRLMKKGQSVEGGANNTRFTDLQDPTFFFMISWADNQGIIKGTSATTFNPKGSITLQDAYTMIVRALGYEKEETLPYPFGYIDVAEQDGVELDEGLDSSVGYTDALTRGDVAIILYNAFFAETGVAETYNEERQLKDDDGKVVNIVLESKTRYPALCEKVFDVLNVEYQAVATPKYVFDDAATETTGDLGYEAIQFVLTDDDMTSDEKDDAPVEFYASFDELNLPGTADDYIMSKFNMYIKADDNELDSILYAEPLLVKKTVSDIKLDQVTTNKAGSYYGNDTDGAKRLSGKATIGGKVAYFFDAPYSYAQPTYTGTGDIARYNDRNEKNLKFINFELLGTADDGEYKFVKEDDLFLAGADIYADDDEKDFHVSDSEALIEKLLQVYTGGLYEATVYDVDGDGIYDYINYMPYSYAIVDTDDDYTFEEDGFGDDDVIYTTDAFVEGEKFEDEDFIVGYFNQDANYIKVAYVIEPVETKVSSYRKNTGIVTLANGDKVSAEDGWKYVDNYLDGEAEGLKELNYSIDDVEWQLDELLSPSALDLDKNAKFYVYDGVVLYQEGVDNKVTFDSNLIVLTNDPDNDDQVFDTSSLIVATGKKTTYAYAWVDGETKYVPIDTDADVWPKIKDYINVDNDENPYFNKIATYTVDGDGLYTIKLLGNAYDESEMTDDDYIGIDKDPTIFKDDKDDTLQYYGETTDEVTLTRRSTGIFDVNLDVVSQVKLTDTSIVLIKSTYYDEAEKEDVTEFVKLGLSNFKDTLSNKLTNVQFILENDPDTTRRENLVVLYGETFTVKPMKKLITKARPLLRTSESSSTLTLISTKTASTECSMRYMILTRARHTPMMLQLQVPRPTLRLTQ